MAKLSNYDGHFCESDYEYAFIALLEQEEWKYTSGKDVKREKKNEVLIADDFKGFISKMNSELTDDEVTQIYDTVRLIGGESEFAALHKVYGFMVNGIQFTPQNAQPKMIPLIDYPFQ